jgi:hypothetical protein
MRTMFDAVDAKDVPASGFDLLAGYTNGQYKSYGPLLQRFPNTVVVPIDVLNQPGMGRVLDIETGDATPADAPRWFDNSITLGVHRPTLYYSASLHSAVKGSMGSRKYDAWIAEYGPQLTVHSDAQVNVVAWQKADHGPHGENIDVSDVFDDTWNPTGDDMTPEESSKLTQVWSEVHQIFAPQNTQIIQLLQEIKGLLQNQQPASQ